MKPVSRGRTVAVVVLALALWGCATAPQRSMVSAPPVHSGSGANENRFCSWTFDRGPSGRVDPNSVRITNKPGGACTLFRSADRLFIGDSPDNAKEVVDIGAVEFVTKGSCRYCYLNSFGGMTCIVYPGC